MSHRILIIEDDKDIVHLLKVHLRDIGCEVTSAYDGKSGLREANSKVKPLFGQVSVILRSSSALGEFRSRL